MKKHYIYLAGNISTDIKTYEWREEFERLVKEREMRVAVLNPCKNKFNEEMRGYINRGGTDFLKRAKTFGFGVLPRKDRQMIGISTIIVVNFSLIHPKKPSIGTMFELAWADDGHIPIIAIIDPKKKQGTQEYLYANHPFVKDAVSEYVNSVEEAVNLALGEVSSSLMGRITNEEANLGSFNVIDSYGSSGPMGDYRSGGPEHH